MKILKFIFIIFLCFTTYTQAQQKTDKKFVLVIDAGHGGNDPGCHGTKHKEKDVALAVALKFGKFVEENCPDVKVVYTRKTDIFLELNERAKIANDNNADLFICIHCNASPNKKVFGSETYVMGLHKTKGNLDVARRENASILLEDNYKKNYENFDPNSDEANIIFTMYQNAHLDQSLNLADMIQNYYKTKSCRANKGVKQAGFLVLWKTSMPSLLTETGFLTNPEEEKFLGSKKGQEYLASSIFLAFRKYKDEVKGVKNKYNDALENILPCNDKTSFHDEEATSIKDTITAVVKEEIKPILPPEKKPEMVKRDTIINLSIDTSKPLIERKPIVKIVPTKNEETKIIFKVQFYSSAQKLSAKYPKFKGIKNVSELKIGNEFKYFAGEYITFKEALEEQNRLRKKGFKDAFTVAFNGKEKIAVKDALEILKTEK